MKSQKLKKITPILSVIVIAKNEEAKLRDCLETVTWANEIVLVDNGSIDKTVSIAKSFGAKIKILRKGNYSDLRNEGLRITQGDWILYIDADERVTQELRKEIQNILKEPTKETFAFAIPRRNIILGKEMKHGGWWPDYVKRLYLKNNLEKWVGELHEEPVFKGDLGHLKNPLIHIKHDNLSEMVEKTNIWSEVEARLMYKNNHPKMNVPRFITAIMREFWLRMIKNRAYLDGSEGIIYALYQVYSRFISYAKLWEMQLERDKI